VASCALIEGMLQAYIDGELAQSERVICEEHIADCPTCRGALRRQARVSVELFEVFAPCRLNRNLSAAVLQHLPEMDAPPSDVQGLNWRAKHPLDFLTRAGRFVPVAAVFLLVCLGVVLHSYWPTEEPFAGAIGVVTQNTGDASRVPDEAVTQELAQVKTFVKPGERYLTGEGSMLMLALCGPTQIKMNENTRIRVESDRQISLETGQVWLDIGKDGRLFKVATPSGKITVYGTTFDVRVDNQKTTVTVEEGQVMVENHAAAFGSLSMGEQAEIGADDVALAKRQVDVRLATGWSRRIEADREAHDIFTKVILPKTEPLELLGQETWSIVTMRQGQEPAPVKALVFEWKQSRSSGHCAYDIYVSDEKMQSLFKARVLQTVFQNGRRTYEMAVPGGTVQNVNVLHVQVVPDRSVGDNEVTFTKVSARTS